MLFFQGRVYAVGGFNGSLRVRTVDFYDPLRDAWSSAPNMEARRSTLGVAVLNDCIYAVGGFDGSTGLNSAEVLDLSVASPMMVISRFKIIIKLRERLSCPHFFLFFVKKGLSSKPSGDYIVGPNFCFSS